jgi:superfamily II DNA or RNA helicase
MAECIRTVENISTYDLEYRLDHSSFNKEKLKEMLPIISPKITKVIEKIRALDEQDMKKDKKLYKHMIFSDLKSEGGAKTVGGAFLANGFQLIYDDHLKIKKTSKGPNSFAILCSTKIYGKDVGIKFRRQILDIYNKRPENVYGEHLRFIILDYGFKEGIDLFDIKYIHILENPLTRADEKQIIGRGTRFCGQKGLNFDKTEGWPLYIFRYKAVLPPRLQQELEVDTLYNLFIKLSKLDQSKDTFARELEKICIQGSIDFYINRNMHEYNPDFKSILKNVEDNYSRFFILEKEGYGKTKKANIQCSAGCKAVINLPTELLLLVWYMRTKLELIHDRRPRSTLCKYLIDNKEYCKLINTIAENYQDYIATNYRKILSIINNINSKDTVIRNQKLDILKFLEKTAKEIELTPETPKNKMNYYDMQTFMMYHFKKYTWPQIKLENLCETKPGQDSSTVEFTPTQLTLQTYFQPANPYKGMLLWHSTGVGKTCTGISVASNSFEKEGYTILWVTRNTLIGDIWKNMFKQICSIPLKNKKIDVEAALKRPSDYVSDRWMMPMTYKQFSNLLLGKNKLYEEIVKRNGKEDPLKKTLIIIDEAHKLLSEDLKPQERPNFSILKKFIHNSYEKSKKDSVRVLLMTATPYTTNPSTLIKLLNLLRPEEEQLVEDYDIFKTHYLDSQSRFKYPIEFLNQLSGYISYLNREGDIRQFARPIVEDILVPISESSQDKLEEKLKKIENELTKTQDSIDFHKEEKRKAKEKLKTEKQLLLNNCKLIKDKDQKEMCKKSIDQKIKQFEKAMTDESDLVINKLEEKMILLKRDVKNTKNIFKDFKESDPSQERMLLEKCLKQES